MRPAAYFDPAQFESEQANLFHGAWHFVGTTHDVPKPGSFFTRTLLGTPMIIRNFGGEIRALSNICAHRHCLLTSAQKGKTEALRCQYHGWEYQSDGLTSKIPGAQYFKPLGGSRPSIPAYRTALCGALIFVTLDDEAPALPEFLGELYALCQRRFGSGWKQTLAIDTAYAANWKVPVENALESYHIPLVHPATFAKDPGEEGSENILRERWSGFRAGRFATRWIDILKDKVQVLIQIERVLTRNLGMQPRSVYRHLHHFPNFLLSFTDTIGLIHAVEPASPTRSFGMVRQFGPYPHTAPLWIRILLKAWNRLEAYISKRIVLEDIPIYAAVQSGLESSEQEGMLGRCEERIYFYQKWLLEKTVASRSDAGAANDAAPALDSEAAAQVFIDLDCPASGVNPGTETAGLAASVDA